MGHEVEAEASASADRRGTGEVGCVVCGTGEWCNDDGPGLGDVVPHVPVDGGEITGLGPGIRGEGNVPCCDGGGADGGGAKNEPHTGDTPPVCGDWPVGQSNEGSWAVPASEEVRALKSDSEDGMSPSALPVDEPAGKDGRWNQSSGPAAPMAGKRIWCVGTLNARGGPRGKGL